MQFPDMQGCIDMCTRVDPDVRLIRTFIGGAADTQDERINDEWRAGVVSRQHRAANEVDNEDLVDGFSNIAGSVEALKDETQFGAHATYSVAKTLHKLQHVYTDPMDCPFRESWERLLTSAPPVQPWRIDGIDVEADVEGPFPIAAIAIDRRRSVHPARVGEKGLPNDEYVDLDGIGGFNTTHCLLLGFGWVSADADEQLAFTAEDAERKCQKYVKIAAQRAAKEGAA
jgi:hypothetical protein